MQCWSTLLTLYSLPGYTGPPSTQFKLPDKESHSLTKLKPQREGDKGGVFFLSADLVSVVEGGVGGVGVGEPGQVAG